MSWEKDAACKDKPLEWFIPDGATGRGAYDLGREVCRVCPVREACLESAMREERGQLVRHGMRGGLNPSQRITLARTRKVAA